MTSAFERIQLRSAHRNSGIVPQGGASERFHERMRGMCIMGLFAAAPWPDPIDSYRITPKGLNAARDAGIRERG